MVLKRRLTYWFAALLCAALAALTASTVHAQVTLPQSVNDPRGRFAMSFPADWEVVTKVDGMVALIGAGPAKAGHRPSVNVVVESLPKPMPPDTYAAAAEPLAKTTFHNYTVVQQSSASVQGRPAYYRYFTWETNTGVTLYQLQVFFTDGPTGFVVTATTVNDPDRIREEMPLMTQIIDTFHIGPQ